MCGTDTAYATTACGDGQVSAGTNLPIVLHVCYAVSGTDLGYRPSRCPVRTQRMLLRDVLVLRYGDRLCAYWLSYTVCGGGSYLDVYGAGEAEEGGEEVEEEGKKRRRRSGESVERRRRGEEEEEEGGRQRSSEEEEGERVYCPQVAYPRMKYCSICACYALSDTSIGYRAMQCPVLAEAIVLCNVRLSCYAMSGTSVGYRAMQCPVLRYAMPVGGVELTISTVTSLSCYAYAARCPVLREAILLRVCYAVSGTDLRYAATRITWRPHQPGPNPPYLPTRTL
eukprot:980139-Rhodomonas_salina.3